MERRTLNIKHIVNVNNFIEALHRAKCDCWEDCEGNQSKGIYGLPLGQIMEIAFENLVKTVGSWAEKREDSIRILKRLVRKLENGDNS